MAKPGHHLLIVDDDSEIRALLAEQLSAAAYRVSTAADGSEMRRALNRGGVDLVVLDLSLPREDGLTLCRDLRSKSQLPVIMLTARGDPLDRILGLEMGADDYLAKPFEPRELLARIRSVLRRAQSLPANLEPLAATTAEVGDWIVDFEQRTLQDADGRMTMLSGAEFRILKILVQHANRVLPRDQLIALGALGSDEASDRAVDLQISRLRQKFGSRGAVMIRTVRNEGYVLAAPVVLR